MHFSATATVFAVATSLADGSTTSGKSNKSSKNGGCTFCSSNTLIRSDMLTNIVFGNLADDNNEITRESIAEFCRTNTTQAFIQAVGNSAGCLVEPQCFAQGLIQSIYFDFDDNATLTEGQFQAGAVNGLCYAEQNDVILLEDEEGCSIIDPCDAINDNGGDDGLLGDPPSAPSAP